jgi:hypothetical protein
LRFAYFREPCVKRLRANSLAKVRDPERRAKIVAAKRGKPRPPRVIEALRNANIGKAALAKTRRRMRLMSADGPTIRASGRPKGMP